VTKVCKRLNQDSPLSTDDQDPIDITTRQALYVVQVCGYSLVACRSAFTLWHESL